MMNVGRPRLMPQCALTRTRFIGHRYGESSPVTQLYGVHECFVLATMLLLALAAKPLFGMLAGMLGSGLAYCYKCAEYRISGAVFPLTLG